jgi:hypothetical protein
MAYPFPNSFLAAFLILGVHGESECMLNGVSVQMGGENVCIYPR